MLCKGSIAKVRTSVKTCLRLGLFKKDVLLRISVYNELDDGDKRENYTPILKAAYYGDLIAVKYFLSQSKSNPFDERDRLGNDIFLIASSYDHINLMEFFIQFHKKSFLETRNNSGWNVLQSAVYGPASESVEFLLKKIEWEEEDLYLALKVAERYKTSCANSSERFLQKRVQSYSEIIESINLLLKCNNLIQQYPQHASMIKAAFAGKGLYKTSFTTPLSLRTLCGIFVVNTPRQDSETQLPKEVTALLTELRALTDKLTTALKPLPMHGIESPNCDADPAAPQATKFCV